MKHGRRPVPRIAVVGYSGAGKTSLLEGVARALTEKGVQIAFLKANAHRIDLDREGKDTDRLRRAGAIAIAIDGAGGSVVFSPPVPRLSSSRHPHEPRAKGEPMASREARPDAAALEWEDFEARATLWDLEGVLPEVDLILIEGMKHSPWPKVVVDRADNPRGSMGVEGTRNVLLHCAWPVLPASWDEPVALATQAIEREIARHARITGGITGAVLAGGESRRLGRDKARLPLRGDAAGTWLERSFLLLTELSSDPWVIGRIVDRGGADAPSLRRRPRSHLDLRPGAGPLAGLETALRLAEADEAISGTAHAVLAIPCDLPGLETQVLRLLLEARGSAPALAFRHADGKREPAVVLLETSATKEIARTLDAGENAVVDFLERIGVRWLDLPREWEGSFENVNDPEALRRWTSRTK